ncbi:GNAT family N-acetyltransferase [Nonomuraea sp. CA-218870]|uniref:GNAT family N-acetyltransferase n=1 Tax=Nonomuraea sp. CA-218870 TaxID=3239998 RepID=UPI003D8B2147
MAAGKFYSSRRWLAFCADMADMPTGSITADLPGGGLAALPVSVTGGTTHPFYDCPALLEARGLPAPPPFGLLAGPRFGYQADLLVTPGADRAEAAARLRAAVEEAGLPTLAPYLGTRDVMDLRAGGVTAPPVLLTADAWLRVPAGGWEEYLSTLSGRRAENIRKERAAFAAAGYDVVEAPLGEWAEHAARLLAVTEAKHGHHADLSVYLRMLTLQAKHLGDSARVILCGPPGEPPVGHVLYYIHDDTLRLRSAGFDYARLRGAAEYFNVVVYLLFERAVEAGARWFHAGIASTEAKALRGFELRPLWLLDLTAGGPLDGLDADVRAANARTFASISATPFLTRSWKLGEDDERWLASA